MLDVAQSFFCCGGLRRPLHTLWLIDLLLRALVLSIFLDDSFSYLHTSFSSSGETHEADLLFFGVKLMACPASGVRDEMGNKKDPE